MRVFFTEANQNVINTAVSVRIREANIINTVVNVEPVTYHNGFYSVDMTFYFEIVLDVYTNNGSAPATVNGLSVFSKRVILYGGNGNVAVFTIVQLKRTVQMLIPAFDFCVPDKECVTSTDNPCDMFSKVDFPVEQFFPPNLADIDPDSLETGCGCNGNC